MEPILDVWVKKIHDNNNNKDHICPIEELGTR